MIRILPETVAAPHQELKFDRFARVCPLCCGHVYRDFTWLEKICLFLPFHLALKARFHCDACGQKFTAARNLTDYIFAGVFGLGVYTLKDDWAASLIVLGIWFVVSLVRPRTSVGPFDTFLAAIILSTLWFFVFMLRVHLSPEFMRDYAGGIFGLMGGLGFLCGYGLLYLDRWAYGSLTRIDDDSYPGTP